MSDNTINDAIEQEAAGLEQRFTAVTAKLLAGEPITNEEGTDLLKLISGLNANLTITNEVLFNVQENMPKMIGSIADSVLRRAGRTDKKIRKSVEKICLQNLELFWDMIRMHATAVAASIAEQNKGEEETNEG